MWLRGLFHTNMIKHILLQPDINIIGITECHSFKLQGPWRGMCVKVTNQLPSQVVFLVITNDLHVSC